MRYFTVTPEHLAGRDQVVKFFRKVEKLTHYTRLAQTIRGSAECLCAKCNLQSATGGGTQLRLLLTGVEF